MGLFSVAKNVLPLYDSPLCLPMARPKQSTAPSGSADAPTESQVTALTEAVNRLNQQVQVLTEILDEVRDDLQWAISNREEFRCSPQPFHVTSMPKDPCVSDFHKRVDRVSAKDLPSEELVPEKVELSGPPQEFLWE